MIDNSIWLLGDGTKILFWSDSWCGPPLNLYLQVDEVVDETTLVCDYIHENSWDMPQNFSTDFPVIWNLVQEVTISVQSKENELVWDSSTNGSLSFKDAYIFKASSVLPIHWAKSIWSPNIPPSKSLLA